MAILKPKKQLAVWIRVMLASVCLVSLSNCASNLAGSNVLPTTGSSMREIYNKQYAKNNNDQLAKIRTQLPRLVSGNQATAQDQETPIP